MNTFIQDLPDLPKETNRAVGGMMGDTPVICGGKSGIEVYLPTIDLIRKSTQCKYLYILTIHRAMTV